MYIREHWRSFKVIVGDDPVFSGLAMWQTKLILEVTFNPHLANNVLVQWKIHRRPVFDNESRGYTRPMSFKNIKFIYTMRIVPRQMIAVKKTVVQKVMVPKRMVTSSLKSGVEKKEYTTIHKSITTVDPTTTIQVMIVQLTNNQKRFKTVTCEKTH